ERLPQMTAAHDLIELFGLRHGAREAVEDEAVSAILARDALLDDAQNNRVRHQLAALHVRPGLLSERRPAPNQFAKNVAGRDVRDAQELRDGPGLRALTGSRRPNQNQGAAQLRPVDARAAGIS